MIMLCSCELSLVDGVLSTLLRFLVLRGDGRCSRSILGEGKHVAQGEELLFRLSEEVFHASHSVVEVVEGSNIVVVAVLTSHRNP